MFGGGFQIAFLDEVASVLQIFTIKKPLLLLNPVFNRDRECSVIGVDISWPFGEVFSSCCFFDSFPFDGEDESPPPPQEARTNPATGTVECSIFYNVWLFSLCYQCLYFIC